MANVGRRQARRQALFLLYQWDLTGEPLATSFDGAPISFALELAEAVAARAALLDARITAASDEWRADRLGTLERNILRVGVYELEEGVGCRGGDRTQSCWRNATRARMPPGLSTASLAASSERLRRETGINPPTFDTHRRPRWRPLRGLSFRSGICLCGFRLCGADMSATEDSCSAPRSSSSGCGRRWTGSSRSVRAATWTQRWMSWATSRSWRRRFRGGAASRHERRCGLLTSSGLLSRRRWRVPGSPRRSAACETRSPTRSTGVESAFGRFVPRDRRGRRRQSRGGNPGSDGDRARAHVSRVHVTCLRSTTTASAGAGRARTWHSEKGSPCWWATRCSRRPCDGHCRSRGRGGRRVRRSHARDDGGQYLDITGAHSDLVELHRLKTGRLLPPLSAAVSGPLQCLVTTRHRGVRSATSSGSCSRSSTMCSTATAMRSGSALTSPGYVPTRQQGRRASAWRRSTPTPASCSSSSTDWRSERAEGGATPGPPRASTRVERTPVTAHRGVTSQGQLRLSLSTRCSASESRVTKPAVLRTPAAPG